MITASSTYILAGWPGTALAIVAQGILIVFLFTGLHESIHRTAFATPWLNDIVATVFGFVVMLSPTWYRCFHLEHHLYTNDRERDPELAGPKPATKREYAIHVSGLPETWGRFTGLWRNAIFFSKDSYVQEEKKKRVMVESRCYVGGYVALFVISMALNTAVLFWLWVLPILVGNPFLRLYLLAQHTNCAHVPNMLENTRTVLSNPLVRSIAWNMPYHAAHHSYPNIPFHKLPLFHSIVKDDFANTEYSYWAFHRKYIRSLH